MAEINVELLKQSYEEYTKDFRCAFKLLEVERNKFDENIYYLTFANEPNKFLPTGWLSKIDITWQIREVETTWQHLKISVWFNNGK